MPFSNIVFLYDSLHAQRYIKIQCLQLTEAVSIFTAMLLANINTSA